MIKAKQELILIIHNVRSCYNVGSLLRTADGLAAQRVYMSGYTPSPQYPGDPRLPHVRARATAQIEKTSLGAEKTIQWEVASDLLQLMEELRNEGWLVAALEQTKNSVSLPSFNTPKKIALVVGREVEGLEKEVLNACDTVLEIPMLGQKESFNVAAAAAMALYHLRFLPQSLDK